MSFGRRAVDWELKGVPVRIEVGPRDLATGQVTLVRRDLGTKAPCRWPRWRCRSRACSSRSRPTCWPRPRRGATAHTVDVATVDEAAEAVADGFARVPWRRWPDRGRRGHAAAAGDHRALPAAPGRLAARRARTSPTPSPSSPGPTDRRPDGRRRACSDGACVTWSGRRCRRSDRCDCRATLGAPEFVLMREAWAASPRLSSDRDRDRPERRCSDMSVAERVSDLVAPSARRPGPRALRPRARAGGVVRIMVDSPAGSTSTPSPSATRLISRELDHADPMPGPLHARGHSPGLERPLRTPDHFRRAVGQAVHRPDPAPCRRRPPGARRAGRRPTTTGVAVAPSSERHRAHLRYADIERARTVFELGCTKPAEPGQGPSSQSARHTRR